MFLHVFMSRETKGEVCIELPSLGSEGLMEVCDSDVLSCGAGHSDFREIYGDVLYEVCQLVENEKLARSISRSRRRQNK